MAAQEQILNVAREIVAEGGPVALSFDAIAKRMGKTKQAVLYWYPTKAALLAALFLPALEAEVAVAEDALIAAEGRGDAIARFVREVAAFHLGDLDRFRMMYLMPQTARGGVREADRPLMQDIHPITDRLYTALAHHLGGACADARREAVAVHGAVLGLVLMFALADAVNDPLKHAEEGMIAALIASLGGQSV
jgi:AcrR family transcriptional regulator